MAAADKQFQQHLKNGAIPVHFWKTARPENHCGVWSQELKHYYTKPGIIAKFGPNAQISPINETLSEAAELKGERAGPVIERRAAGQSEGGS